MRVEKLPTKVVFQVIALVILFAISVSVLRALAKESVDFDISCRAKAKEVAATTYRSCVTENKNAHLEKIKKEYQAKIKSLKEDYEKEIQKLGGKLARSKNSDKNLPAKKVYGESMEGDSSTDSNSSEEPTVISPATNDDAV